MNPRFTLARIAGIPIRTGWSTLIIAAVISWSLATTIIPWAAPDASSDATWIGALLGAVLFLGSLLAHEMGHALAARRRGIEVEEVALWVFGGVARLRSEPQRPADEAIVAAAGPAVSIGIAALASLSAVGTAVAGLPTTTAVLAWLGVTNGLLALFNLLPGLPLDGGRLLHAALWARSGRRVESRAQAATAGRVVGAGIAGLGLLQFAAGGGGGLWTALVGWFVFMSATQVRRGAQLAVRLDGIRVRDAARTVPHTVAWYEPIGSVLRRTADGGDRFVLVTGPEGWVVGLIDLHRLAAVPPAALEGLQAGQVAATTAGHEGPVFVGADETMPDALERATGAPFLVVDDGRVVGLVADDDLALAAERRRRAELADALHPLHHDSPMAGAR